ncbi:MAG: peptidase domain-containing ABC transporter [Bacteroidota bacterium]|jgi:ABC-type bacteriocin/lantibiotic exporter with double-glycine peptidase domain
MKFDKRKKLIARQLDQSDCGVACLASVIEFYGGEAKIEDLRRHSGASRQGTTLSGLAQAAQKYGINASGLRANTVNNLVEMDEAAVVHVINDSGQNHYIVYYGSEKGKSKGLIGDARVELGDPSKGIITMSLHELDRIWKSKTLLKLTPNELFQTKTLKKTLKKEWLINLIRKDLRILLISVFLGIVISILGVSTALFSQSLIDEILPTQNTKRLFTSLFFLSIILAIRSTLSYLRGLFITRQSMDFNTRVMKEFWHNILMLPKSFFDTRKTGDLLARMNDTRRIQSVLSIISGGIIIDILLIVVSISFTFVYSKTIGLIVIGTLPVFSLILIWFNKPIILAQREVMSKYAIAESCFVDSMQGISVIKSTNKQSFFEEMNIRAYEFFQSKIYNLGKLSIRFSWISDLVSVSFVVCIFAVSSGLVLSNHLTLGEMVALLGISSAIIPSVNRIVAANMQMQEALVAFDRMFEFASLDNEINEQNLKTSFNLTDEFFKNITLSFIGVSFRFPGRKSILKSVSFEVQKGYITGLLGESGGGKSTILQIIQKFYFPDKGKVELNKTDLMLISSYELRNNIGYVQQDSKIFNGSLLFNVTLSNRQEDHENAIKFCEKNGFAEYFDAFPDNYLTYIGEDGVSLSGGQKQLVVFARALFRNPKILLLDEATSAMDSKMEHFTFSLLQKHKHDMAILLVTHQLKIAKDCDIYFFLNDGMTSRIEHENGLNITS